MLYRPLGKTGFRVSAVAFGAGPVPALMTNDGGEDQQLSTIRKAIDLGINWFDTAATYGAGRSERNLGAAIRQCNATGKVYIATKVRLPEDQLHDIRSFVLRSFEESLQRLDVPRVSLLQLHNSITKRRGDQPTSLAPSDVLERGGVLDAMHELKRNGVVEHLGLTGLGEPAMLAEVIRSGEFSTVQTPYNLLNPRAGQGMPESFADTNYGNQFEECGRQEMGVFAIRVFAGGALVGQPPSEHTKKTPFFPLDLYQRDQERAFELEKRLPPGTPLAELALRFVLTHANVSAAIIGFSSPAQVEEVVQFAERGPLSDEELADLAG